MIHHRQVRAKVSLDSNCCTTGNTDFWAHVFGLCTLSFSWRHNTPMRRDAEAKHLPASGKMMVTW